jgi:hypothetical protein
MHKPIVVFTAQDLTVSWYALFRLYYVRLSQSFVFILPKCQKSAPFRGEG